MTSLPLLDRKRDALALLDPSYRGLSTSIA
jgi:hypothetical protein